MVSVFFFLLLRYFCYCIFLCCLYRFRVFDIGNPFLVYRINVTVQMLDYKRNTSNGAVDRWKTIGYAVIGPQLSKDNTNRKKPGVTSGPQV